MRKLILALLLAGLGFIAPPKAEAQTPVALNCYAGPTLPLWAPCNAALPLQVQVVGGSSGLSVVDQTAWVQGTSPFTPTGCVFNDTATLASGQEGTLRCTTDRQAKVLDSAVLAAVQAPIPSQSPAVPIGGVALCDGANGTTNPCATAMTVKPASTAPVTATDKAAVVALRPDSPGIIALGQTTKSASVPVTIASDQYVDPCQSPNIAKSSAVIAITSAATTSLVAVSGSTTVYVCGFSFSASQVVTTANALTFEYGTGAACSSPVVLTGPYGTGGITAGPPVHYSAGNAGQTIFKSAASNGICALTTIGATAAFEGFISYVQQ